MKMESMSSLCLLEAPAKALLKKISDLAGRIWAEILEMLLLEHATIGFIFAKKVSVLGSRVVADMKS